MSATERQLAELRAARDAARDALDSRIARARVDLEPAVLRQRVMADAKVKALALATEAIEIANDSRGVVIGTGAALALWLARRPIGRAAADLWATGGNRKPEPGAIASAGQWLTDQFAKALARARKEINEHD
jgi:hypothetical protein